ncbi:MAG: nucleoside triphosphate pyrophosphohydrolase [Clostridiales bacterium]|nr:nucleoside triphosphate pyrophosphohydrolase [Clostridiales bacterium]
MEDLLRIMRLLRSPEGCPWDREQDHKSIRSNFLEETHEALEAIEREDAELLREELGDVLMQVVFHACIEEERDSFTFDDVVDGVSRKLVVRHPHVFGEVQADDTAQVLKNWDAIKRETKGGKTQADLLRSLPRSLPALMRAAKVQTRAKRVGFDWPELSGAMASLESELAELKEAVAAGAPAAVEEELGDLLFSVVNVSRFLQADAEQALTGATDKFIRRFTEVERLAEQQGMDMPAASLEELDRLWDQAKAAEKGR